eukprot:6620886-Prymnesium_polylepis.1
MLASTRALRGRWTCAQPVSVQGMGLGCVSGAAQAIRQRISGEHACEGNIPDPERALRARTMASTHFTR